MSLMRVVIQTTRYFAHICYDLFPFTGKWRASISADFLTSLPGSDYIFTLASVGRVVSEDPTIVTRGFLLIVRTFAFSLQLRFFFVAIAAVAKDSRIFQHIARFY